MTYRKKYIIAVIFLNIINCSLVAAATSVRSDVFDGNQVNGVDQRQFANGIEKKETTRGLVASLSADTNKRFSAVEQRIEKLEEKSVSEHGVGKIFLEIVEKIIADAVGFAVLAIIFSIIVKRELVKTVKEGMEAIGTVFAGSFVTNVVPEIINFRTDAISVLRSKSFFYEQGASIPATQVVDEELEKVAKLIGAQKFHDAEQLLIALGNKYPDALKIVATLYDLYSNSAYEAANDATSLAKKAIKMLDSKQAQFSGVPDYYYLVARAHCKFADAGVARIHYKLAVTAATQAINLDSSNPRWLSLRGLVHDMFNVIEYAVNDTEKALELAEEKQDEVNIARAKNNLAFYYAEQGKPENKDLAISYARAAVKYDEEHKNAEHISLDTLGFVLMTFGETKEEFEEAVEALTIAVKVDPQDAEIGDNLIEAKKRLESFQQADC